MSEDAFKNIQVLRGIPVNEFMGTMGFFAASLSMNCTDCHVTESAGNWDRYADDTPLKQTARRMVLMENLINRADFGEYAPGDLLHLPSRRPEPRGHAEPGRAVRRSASGRSGSSGSHSRELPTIPAPPSKSSTSISRPSAERSNWPS